MRDGYDPEEGGRYDGDDAASHSSLIRRRIRGACAVLESVHSTVSGHAQAPFH